MCVCVGVCVVCVWAVRKNLNIFVTILSDISRLIVVPVNKLLSFRKFWFLLKINAVPFIILLIRILPGTHRPIINVYRDKYIHISKYGKCFRNSCMCAYFRVRIFMFL